LKFITEFRSSELAQGLISDIRGKIKYQVIFHLSFLALEGRGLR
jgi:hypothetical protein